MSAADNLDESLLDHLMVEFLDHGRRAVEFLRSAQALLAAPPASAPRTADMIAYCLREAMKAVPESQDTGDGGQWRTRSRSVVEAKERYERTKDLPGEDSDAALQDMLARIDAMALTHQESSIHQKRLIAVVVNRTGAQPLISGVDPVGSYQNLLSRLDEAVHHRVNMDEAMALWVDCLSILRQLFLPPDVRNAELKLLAALDSPGPDDVPALVAMLAGPNHLRYFLSKIQSPAWLTLLAESELLEPPSGQAAWPMFAAVAGLKDSHADDVAHILQAMMDRWGSSLQKAWYVARAALDLGAEGRSVIMSALRRHPGNGGLSYFAIAAATSGNATDIFVEAVADIVLNSRTWVQASLHPEPLLTALIDGMTSDNCTARIKLLSYKIRRIPTDDHDRRYFAIDNLGRLDEEVPGYRQNQPFYALLRALIRSLQKATEWADAGVLLQAMSPLPDDIRARVRIWLLATASSIDSSDLILSIADAISSRYPTADDLRAVDRVVAESSGESYLPVWAEAVGTPPTVAELSAALAAGNVSAVHRYVFQWSVVLPQPVLTEWATAIAIMSGAYGEPSRQSLEQQGSAVMLGYGQSPISEADLRAMFPAEAARWIAAWRPDPTQWLVSALELGRTLQFVVKADTASWTSTPVETAGMLRHPTYIHHYIQGLADAESLAGAPVDGLVDLVVLVRAHPWPATTLGSDPDDFDRDWRPAEHASVELIKAMASSDMGFGARRDEVWIILLSEAENHGEISGISSDDFDPMASAINRPCTRALEAILSFLGHEYRLDNTIRLEALNLLSTILQLDGKIGAEHRAILATRIGFLRYIAPAWFEQHHSELFGDAAPSGLGQVSVDLAVRWGQPNKWLLENYPNSIKDAVGRRVERALEHYLVAMLWNAPGYAVSEAVVFLKSKERLSAAGEAIGRLLKSAAPPPELKEVAVQFWEGALGVNAADSLAGFGWYAEVESIDTDTWIDLTLRTVKATRGQIDWGHKVAERAAAQPPTAKTLDILNHLVRGVGDDWDRREIASIAAQTIQQAHEFSAAPEYRRLQTTLTERGAL